MKSSKAGRLESALNDIFQLLSQYGDVTVNATVGGRTVQIRMVDGEGAPAPAARVATKAGANTPDPERVFEAISAVPIGLTLEDLATKLSVRPRNLLKPVIQALVRAGRVKKVGRRHRSSTAVVRRGPPPKEGRVAKPAAKPGRKKAVSPAKLAALAKAREARAAKRAAAAGKKVTAAPKAAKPKGKPGRPPKAAAKAAPVKAAPAKPSKAPERNKALGVSETKLSALAKAREALAKAREARAAKGKAKPSKADKVVGNRATQRKNAMTDAVDNEAAASEAAKAPGADSQ